MTTNHNDYENDTFYTDYEEFYEAPEEAWEYDFGGYEDYEPSPYDGTYSEC